MTLLTLTGNIFLFSIVTQKLLEIFIRNIDINRSRILFTIKL